ncbi:uncharacterized protein LOC121369931 [Gigantopelta aegis]|uniref:uncharacterized protein LOC121369931 n=1 Tax=Gigantopelta aegis TaxID=1735272 RepID=UPI001B88D88C|nr:uncharacterized protein LOC121369931 [Gigantopelta aegis]
MTEQKEIGEFVGSPSNVVTSSLPLGTLPPLNDDFWDDCESEISILPDLLSKPGAIGCGDIQLNDGFDELVTYVEQKSQDRQQSEQTEVPVQTGEHDGDVDHVHISGQIQTSMNRHCYHQLDVSQHNLMLESNTSSPALSKNAIAARENRLKKKKYVENLEKSFTTLNEENITLKSKVESYETTIARLNSEVAYLKNVLINQSTLSALLKNIQSTPGIKFKTSLPTTSSSTLTEKNKSDSVDDNQKNIYSSLRRSKRKSAVSNYESEKKVRKVLSDTVIESTSYQGMIQKVPAVSNDDMSAESVRNKSISAAPESAEGMDDCQITSSQRLNGGVCLHVTGEMVSLEFCQKCNKNSQSDLIFNDHPYFRLSHDS